MTFWMTAYFIGSSFALLVLIFMVCSMKAHLSWLKEFTTGLRDKWAQTESRARKMEKAVDWFLSRSGMKLDYSSRSWDWSVVPMEKPKWYNDDAWKQMVAHREEIVYALYEANKRALHDWDSEKTNKEKKKGGKK